MAEKGQQVPALERYPALPPRLDSYLKCYSDLIAGGLTLRSVEEWCSQYGLSDFEQVYDVLRIAEKEVTRWQTTQRKLSDQQGKSSSKAGKSRPR